MLIEYGFLAIGEGFMLKTFLKCKWRLITISGDMEEAIGFMPVHFACTRKKVKLLWKEKAPMPEKFACDNLGHDAEGNYCIIKQLEGHNCGCPYEDAEIDWVKQHGVRRPQLKDHAGVGDGVCMDYEP